MRKHSMKDIIKTLAFSSCKLSSDKHTKSHLDQPRQPDQKSAVIEVPNYWQLTKPSFMLPSTLQSTSLSLTLVSTSLLSHSADRSLRHKTMVVQWWYMRYTQRSIDDTVSTNIMRKGALCFSFKVNRQLFTVQDIFNFINQLPITPKSSPLRVNLHRFHILQMHLRRLFNSKAGLQDSWQ